MSISLVSAPEDHQPVYNPVEFIFSSTNWTKCDFAYVCDLYVNGAFSIRLKAFPDPVSGDGTVRVDRVLQDFVSYDFDPEVTDFADNQKSICDYYLEIRERYNTSTDCTGQSTTSSVLYTSTKKYAWNGTLQYHEQPVYDESDYILEGLTSRFLTSVPNGIKLSTEDHFILKAIQAMSSGDGTSYEMIVTTYDYDDNVIGTFTHANPFYNTSATEEMMITVPAGPKNIASIASLGPSVKYYTVAIRDNLGDNLSETKTFYLSDRCTKFRSYRFWWLNRRGGFDAFTFDMRSTRRLDLTRSTFTRFLPTNYAVGDRGETVISVADKSAYVVASDWITEAEAAWLEELFTSPEVYVYETKKETKRIKITGAVCNCPISVFDITGAVHDSGTMTADLVIDDTLVGPGGIPTGTFFSYTGTNFTAIGSPNSGVHKQITGYDPIGGVYHTDIVSSINAGALVTGTVTLEADPCSVTFILADGVTLPIGTEFSYRVADGSPIGLANFGTGTVIGHGPSPGEHETDVGCSINAGALVTGTLKYIQEIKTKIPIVVSSPTYEEKIKANIKNIQYTLEFRTSYSTNVQGI